MEQEFRKVLPTDVSVHAARIRLQKVVVSELKNMKNEIEREAVKLADANVDVISFGCTTGSLVAGVEYDKEIVELIRKVTQKPAVATAGAVVQSLKALGVSRISVATPYTEDLNKRERRFLEQNGFSVDKIVGLGLVDNLKIAETKPETLSSLVRKANTIRAEGIFISCTNLPAIDRIAVLEQTLKKPVVSSNTATLWAIMKELGKLLEAPKLGKLFALV
jgi:maleate isomerase